MLTTTKSGIARFIENCVSQGMKKVVTSPGSRNAPLIIAIDNHPEIDTVVITDERSAGFFALGMSQQLKEPVGVVCTSGSAMLNYYPAVAEAYYQCVPLVVISADRPSEWVNHGDGQTIVQKGVYANHIRAEVEIDEYVDQETIEFDEKIIDAFRLGNEDWKGPIHFNCPITEPMYDAIKLEISVPGLGLIEKNTISPEDLMLVKEAWNKSSKRMILCGQMEYDISVLNSLVELCEDSSVAVLVENTSNLTHSKFNHCIDRSLSSISANEMEEFQPDLLITIGGAIISKRIKTFLRGTNVKTHFKIGNAFPEMDTYRHLTRSIRVTPGVFLKELLKFERTEHVSQFGWKWKQKDFVNQDRLPVYLEQAPYSDLKVFEVVLDCIPDGAHLHMANSSVVRYCQLFDPIKSIRYHSNRGTSGIDGSSSTAAGASYANQDALHVLITGDLSFFYDSNAFWNNYLGDNLKVIVINNNGGGIFRIIEGPSKTEQLEKYFETDQKGSVEGMCIAYRMRYSKANDIDEVESEMVDLLSKESEGMVSVLEINTPNAMNDGVLKEFFNHFKSD